MKRFYLLVLVVTLFAACVTDDTQDVLFVDVSEPLTVGFEEDTRIQLDDVQKIVWTEGDLVSVFYRSNTNQKWQFQSKTGGRLSNLKPVSAGYAREVAEPKTS